MSWFKDLGKILAPIAGQILVPGPIGAGMGSGLYNAFTDEDPSIGGVLKAAGTGTAASVAAGQMPGSGSAAGEVGEEVATNASQAGLPGDMMGQYANLGQRATDMFTPPSVGTTSIGGYSGGAGAQAATAATPNAVTSPVSAATGAPEGEVEQSALSRLGGFISGNHEAIGGTLKGIGQAWSAMEEMKYQKEQDKKEEERMRNRDRNMMALYGSLRGDFNKPTERPVYEPYKPRTTGR